MAYRSSSVADLLATTTISVPVPAGAAINDIAILVINLDNTGHGTLTFPAGFTTLFTTTVSGPDQHTQALAWKRLIAADTGNYTVTWTGANDAIGECALFSGRDTSNPPTASEATDTSANASPISVSAATVTALTGDDLLWAGGLDLTSSTATSSCAPPSAFTERQDDARDWCALSIATEDNVSSGATGTITGTWTTTGTAGWLAHLVRIPAAGGAAITSGSSDYYGMRSIAENMINNANPHLLPYDSFTPRGNVPSPVVPYGKSDYYDSRPMSAVLRKPKGSQMQHDAYATRFVQQNPPPGSGGFFWYYDSRPQLISRAGKPSPFTFPHDGFQPRGTINSITPQGFTAPYDSRPWVGWRRGRPELLTHDGGAHRTYVVVVTPSGATAFYDIDKYPALKFRDQHESYPARGLVPTAATPVGWTAFFDIDTVTRAKVHLLPIDIDQTPDLPPPSAPQGWVSFYDVEVIKAKPRDYVDVPSPPAQAAATTFIITAFYDVNLNQLPPRRTAEAAIYDVEPPEPAITAFEFTGFYDVERLRPFLTQQYETYPARGLVPTATTAQGFTASYDLARLLGFPVKLQQHDAYQHFFPPAAVNLGPLGWSMFWDRGKRPLAPDRMPFEFELRYQVPTAATPVGWTHNLDVARIRAFPAQLQQYDSLQRLSFVPPFVVVTFNQYDVEVIKPRAFPYATTDAPVFITPTGWEPAFSVMIKRPFQPAPFTPTPVFQPSFAVPPSAYVSFPELFKRPRAVPYLTWPEQRVAVLNTPAGAGGPTYFYDRRLWVAHRPPVEAMPFDGRGLPFVVVTLIVHRPGESGLLTPVVLTATQYQPSKSGLLTPVTLAGTKAQPALSGIKANPDLSGEVEN